MLYYILGGFAFGLLIPYMARRFAKFMPATPAYALWQLIRPVKSVQGSKKRNLQKTYYWRSLMSGLLTSGLTYIFVVHFETANQGWCVFYLWTILLLAEIDWRTFLLPDILTIPLLIGGFAFSTLGAGWVIGAESALGATAGYVLPVVASVLMLRKSKDAFGGGDIKFLAAIGAWIGLLPLVYVIAAASILMFGYMLVCRKKSAAFGPALSIAAIIVALLFF